MIISFFDVEDDHVDWRIQSRYGCFYLNSLTKLSPLLDKKNLQVIIREEVFPHLLLVGLDINRCVLGRLVTKSCLSEREKGL